MILILLWWGILLFQKSKEIHQLEKELLALQQDQLVSSEVKLRLEQLDGTLSRQVFMIIGEGFVFGIVLLLGIWFINRGYSREIEAIKQKRNFLLAITHELKSPLASIALIFETFKKRHLQGADRDKLIEHGLDETDRLTTLIKNLLLSAQIDKSYQPNFETIDLNLLVQKVADQVQKKHPDHQIETALDPAMQLGAFDQFGIYSVFYNLLENAVKYAGSSEKIVITTSSDQSGYTIEVSDQGPGILETEKRKVFEQFYRSGHEDTRRTKGTGIGLFIVKKMIELHHGKIEILDNKPTGSIFKVFFPKSKS